MNPEKDPITNSESKNSSEKEEEIKDTDMDIGMEEIEAPEEELRGSESPKQEAIRGIFGRYRVKERIEAIWESEEDKLEDTTKERIGQEIKKEIERETVTFCKDWINGEQNKEKVSGVPNIDKFSEDKKVALAIEFGALKDLQEEESYRDKLEEIENLIALKEKAGSENIGITDKFLMLDFLNKKAEALDNEINNQDNSYSKQELQIKKNEQEKLFQVKIELVQKITGRNLESEAAKKVLGSPDFKPEKQYIEEGLKDKQSEIIDRKREAPFRKEWESFSDEEKDEYTPEGESHNRGLEAFLDTKIDEQDELIKELGLSEGDEGVKELLALREAGYNPEELKKKGFISKKIEIKPGQKLSKKDFGKLKNKELKNFEEKIKSDAENELNKEWNEAQKKEIRQGMEKIIAEASLEEGAEDIMNKRYEELKNELTVRWVEEDLKKDKKTREKLGQLKKEYGEEREFDINEAFPQIKELGDEEDFSKAVSEYLKNNFKINRSSKKLEKLSVFKDLESAKENKGIIDFIIEFLLFVHSLVEEEIKQEEKNKKIKTTEKNVETNKK